MDGWLRASADRCGSTRSNDARPGVAQTARSERTRLAAIAALHELGETIADDAAVEAVIACSQHLIEGEAVVEAERRARQSRIDDWRQDLPTGEARLAESERAVAAARATWAEALAPFGLGPDATPTEANDVLDRLGTFFQLRSKADELAHRIAGMQRDLALRAREVASLCAAIAPDLSERPHAEQANALKDRLAAATQAARRRAELGDALQQLADEQASALRDHEQAEAALAGLRRLAGAADDDALRSALQRADRKRQARVELAQLEQGLTTAEHARRTNSSSNLRRSISMPERIEQLALAQHAAQTTAATERRTTLASERARYEARAVRGRRTTRAKRSPDRATRKSGRVRLAHVLRETIDAIARSTRSILARMSELLPVLTGNGFAPSSDARGRRHAAAGGRARVGERVGVDGMSEDARPALSRCASRRSKTSRGARRDAHRARRRTRAFRRRARASALHLLAGLAQRTQVLCFTIAHLVTLAREEIPAQRLVDTHAVRRAIDARGETTRDAAFEPALQAAFERWIETTVRRFVPPLTPSEVRRGVQALSRLYVERRGAGRLAARALDGAAKRAALATYYAPLHFLAAWPAALALARACAAADAADDAQGDLVRSARAVRRWRVHDLGCGTGAVGAAAALALASVFGTASVHALDLSG